MLAPLGLIWAQARDAAGRPVIGADGGMPWHVPEDLRHFQAATRGCPVVMGRRTWESLPERYRPLAGRASIVITRDAAWQPRGLGSGTATRVSSVPEALVAAAREAERMGAPARWVIGGGAVFAETIDAADALVVTELELQAEGDVHAPVIGPAWRLVAEGAWQLSETGVRYRILRYEPRPIAA